MKEVSDALERDTYMSAEEAKAFGIVDHCVVGVADMGLEFGAKNAKPPSVRVTGGRGIVPTGRRRSENEPVKIPSSGFRGPTRRDISPWATAPILFYV